MRLDYGYVASYLKKSKITQYMKTMHNAYDLYSIQHTAF